MTLKDIQFLKEALLELKKTLERNIEKSDRTIIRLHEKIDKIIKESDSKISEKVFYSFVATVFGVIVVSTGVFMNHQKENFKSELEMQKDIGSIPTSVSREIFKQFNIK